MAQLIEVEAVSNPRQVSTKQGDRVVFDVLTPDGERKAIWRPGDDPVALAIRLSQRVLVASHGSGNLTLIDKQPHNAPPLAPPQIAPEDEEAIARDFDAFGYSSPAPAVAPPQQLATAAADEDAPALPDDWRDRYEWHPERKRMMAATVEQVAKLYRFAWDTVGREMAGIELSEESHRAIATTCVLQAVKQ
ncbi:hypothetical protein KR51_00019210 [Rubidibacter lacunae KORDI 51-2]|uniref:Uncharacterized protein n=1 Tax=Rubidibacter lacunae KORDI 51-2 TaxID=582515 RepID=U5DLA1_9CHRO|nr:hypothetical protein [Rubidibacter lacunae]ERN41354.1 hypothetical protein KR51_00019210 [Rubidibacter lacunae KORDI 51-2]